MENNKNEKNIPKLIEIARQKLKTPIKKRLASESHLDHVRQFIQELDLKPHGTVHVPAFMIYDKYCQWARSIGSKPRGQAFFFTKFKLYFNSKKVSDLRHYYIHPQGFDLSIQNQELVKNGNEKKKTQAKRKT
mgnify:CR=1 FL=1